MDKVLQVESHKSSVERKNDLPQPAGYSSFGTAQDVAGLLGCEHMVLTHVQLFIHENPQVFLGMSVLNESFFLSVFMSGIAIIQAQHLPLGLV